MSDPMFWLFYFYVLIGTLVWILMGPTKYADFAVRRYCQRFGRLPPRGYMALAIAMMILLWPRTAASFIYALVSAIAESRR